MKRPFDAIYGRCPVKLTAPLRIPFECLFAFSAGGLAAFGIERHVWPIVGLCAISLIALTIGGACRLRASFYEGALAILYMLRDGKL